MADYWVSQAKHWCKFCQVWLPNDKWNIAKHEQGRRHKERVEEFFKAKRDERNQAKKDEAEADREMQRIEQAALAQHVQDMGGAGLGAGFGNGSSDVGGAGGFGATGSGAGAGAGGGVAGMDVNSLAVRAFSQRRHPGGGHAAAAAAAAAGTASSSDQPKGDGFYLTGGRVYLLGHLHEDKLVPGARCEGIAEEGSGWLPATVLSHAEVVVPNTSLRFRRFRLRFLADRQREGDVVPRDIRIPVAPPPPPPPRQAKGTRSSEEAGEADRPAKQTAEEYDFPESADAARGAWTTVPVAQPPARDEGDDRSSGAAAAVEPVSGEGFFVEGGGAAAGAKAGGGAVKRGKRTAEEAARAARAKAADGDAYSTFNPFGGAYRGVDIQAAKPVTAAELIDASVDGMDDAAVAAGTVGLHAGGANGAGGAGSGGGSSGGTGSGSGSSGGGVVFKKKRKVGKKKNFRAKSS